MPHRFWATNLLALRAGRTFVSVVVYSFGEPCSSLDIVPCHSEGDRTSRGIPPAKQGQASSCGGLSMDPAARQPSLPRLRLGLDHRNMMNRSIDPWNRRCSTPLVPLEASSRSRGPSRRVIGDRRREEPDGFSIPNDWNRGTADTGRAGQPVTRRTIGGEREHLQRHRCGGRDRILWRIVYTAHGLDGRSELHVGRQLIQFQWDDRRARAVLGRGSRSPTSRAPRPFPWPT